MEMADVTIPTPNIRHPRPEKIDLGLTSKRCSDEDECHVDHISPAITPPITDSEPATSPGPKLQAAFVNKLYSIVEDPAVKDVMWTESGLTFLVKSPIEFSKCLHNYFKHNNWQSFVRQLNMYQFHKVNDVFHSNGGAPSSADGAAWEFKHPCFQRGHVELLNNIKRKASRPAPQLRDSYTYTSQLKEEIPYQQTLQPRLGQQSSKESRSAELQRADHLIESLNHRIHGLEESQRILMDQSSSVFGIMRTYQGVLSGIANVLAAAIPDHNTAAIQRDVNVLSQQLTQHQFNPRRQHLQPTHPMHISLPTGPFTPVLSTPALLSPSGWSNPGSPVPLQMGQRTPTDTRSPVFSPHTQTSAPSESSDSYFRPPLQRNPHSSHQYNHHHHHHHHPAASASQQISKSSKPQQQPSPTSATNILTPPLSDAAPSPKDSTMFDNNGLRGSPAQYAHETSKAPPLPFQSQGATMLGKEDRCRTLQSLLNNTEGEHGERKRQRAS